MPILFVISMFFLSFMPLWLCVACIEVKSLWDGTVCPWTERIGLGAMAFMLLLSILVTVITLCGESKRENEEYQVVTAKKDTASTTAYLLSNVLPLLAFDFTLWFDALQFIILFGFLAALCVLHFRCDSNICLELAGYRWYNCSLHSAAEEKKDVTVLIHRRQLNANDTVIVRSLNDELYIGRYKKPPKP